ncbi:MAG TPA: hypothetical protein DD381_11005 [Lentisphaeria bacterium]|nr:MAG: hypothetical protein A2X47_00595 [Lentisphaerae bacterium GWF2_38_69]HBM16856.1 hypothetical protein [Lentisphaeria bacterium]
MLPKIFNWTGNSIAALLLLLMAFLPCSEMAGRLFFGYSTIGVADFLQHLTLWVGLLGAVLAARDNKHLRIAGDFTFLPKFLRVFAEHWTSFLSAAVCWSLCGAGIELITAESPGISESFRHLIPGFIENWLEPFGLFELGNTLKVGGLIPIWIAESIMPLGFGLMALLFITTFPNKSIWSKIIIALSLPCVILLSIIYPEAPSGFALIGIIILIVSAALGAPIFVFIGGAALLLFWSDGVTTSAIPVEMYRIVVSPVFPTIPLFTLAGFILSESNASERFIRVFQSLFGWFPGGVAVAVTMLCAFFTTFTGASGITILALGGLLLPVLLSSGADEKFSIGLLTATGSIGLLFPPSLVVILYAVIAKISILDLFKAGILPGILLVLPVCMMCLWKGRKKLGNSEITPFKTDALIKSIWLAKWELLIPVVALVGIFGGFCTIVEAAALTVLYSLVVEVLIYRDLGIKKLFALLVKCSVLVGGVLIVLGVAMGLTNYLVDAQVPAKAAQWVIQQSWSKWEFLIALNIALLLAGCLMDIYSALIIVVPLILPISALFGINPVHLGIIFIVNLQIGYLTPPVGMNLFLSAFRFNKPLMRIALYVLPFLLLFFLVLILITYVPWISIGIMELFK